MDRSRWSVNGFHRSSWNVDHTRPHSILHQRHCHPHHLRSMRACCISCVILYRKLHVIDHSLHCLFVALYAALLVISTVQSSVLFCYVENVLKLSLTLKNDTHPVTLSSSFNKYGSGSVIFGIGNCQRFFSFNLCNWLWVLTKQVAGICYFLGNHL